MPVRTAHGLKTTGKTAKSGRERALQGGNEASREAEASGRQRLAGGRGGKEAKHARAHCTRALTTGTAKATEREASREAEASGRQEQDGRHRPAKSEACREIRRARGVPVVRSTRTVSAVPCRARSAVQCPQCCAGLCRASTLCCARPQAHPSPGASQLAVACSFWNVKVAKRRFFAHF